MERENAIPEKSIHTFVKQADCIREKAIQYAKKQAVRVVVNSILWRIAIEKRGRMCDCCILNLSELYTSVLVNSIVRIRNNGLPRLLRIWHIRA